MIVGRAHEVIVSETLKPHWRVDFHLREGVLAVCCEVAERAVVLGPREPIVKVPW